MPYPKTIVRGRIKRGQPPTNFSELSYALLETAVSYLRSHGETTDAFRDCLAALNEVNLEFHRVYCAPWSDDAIKRNGGI